MKFISLSTASRTAILAGLAGLTLAGCSGDGNDGGYAPPPTGGTPTPSPTPTPGPAPSPTPTPTPTPTAVSPSEAASRLGSGFSSAFALGRTDQPRDPVSTDIVPLDAASNPIDITNP